jgi:purine nucleoside permease
MGNKIDGLEKKVQRGYGGSIQVILAPAVEFGINAASSITAIVLSRKLDLTKTYFIISGIAGVDPALGTLGDEPGGIALAQLSDGAEHRDGVSADGHRLP